jgi:hypothetical protein
MVHRDIMHQTIMPLVTMTIAGMRYTHTTTRCLPKQYFDYVGLTSLCISVICKKPSKRDSGSEIQKGFSEHTEDHSTTIWAEDEALRAPFIDSIPAIPVLQKDSLIIMAMNMLPMAYIQ